MNLYNVTSGDYRILENTSAFKYFIFSSVDSHMLVLLGSVKSSSNLYYYAVHLYVVRGSLEVAIGCFAGLFA